MNKNLVSVVVPVYNVEKYLKRCLDSIVEQSYDNLEIILVDDGSTDTSGKICDDYAKKDSRIIVVHKKNGGLSDARNTGIKKASGRYLTFIDSDDTFEPDSVEYLLRLLKEQECDISIGEINVIKNNKNRSKPTRVIEKVLDDNEAMKLYLVDRISTSSCAKMYERRLFDSIEFPVGKTYEDNGTIYKVIDAAKKIVLSNKVVYNYFINSNTITTSKSSQSLDLISLTDEMCEFLKNKYPSLSDYMLGRRILARFKIINKYFEQKTYKDKTIDDCINFIWQNKKYIRYTDPKKKMAIRLLLAHKGIYAKAFTIVKK